MSITIPQFVKYLEWARKKWPHPARGMPPFKEKKMRLRFALPLALLCSALAQTTYNSVFTSVNLGEPSTVTFQFGHKVDGTPGTTELVIQCSFGRAFLYTNFDVYGLQAGNTSPIYVSCVKTGLRSYMLQVPEQFTVSMSDGSTIDLTINNAYWGVISCPGSRWGCGVGAAQITY